MTEAALAQQALLHDERAGMVLVDHRREPECLHGAHVVADYDERAFVIAEMVEAGDMDPAAAVLDMIEHVVAETDKALAGVFPPFRLTDSVEDDPDDVGDERYPRAEEYPVDQITRRRRIGVVGIVRKRHKQGVGIFHGVRLLLFCFALELFHHEPRDIVGAGFQVQVLDILAVRLQDVRREDFIHRLPERGGVGSVPPGIVLHAVIDIGLLGLVRP